MEAVKCKYGHYYDKALGKCPICQMEGQFEDTDSFTFDPIRNTLVRCKNGHFYNAGLDACPICGQSHMVYSIGDEIEPFPPVTNTPPSPAADPVAFCSWAPYVDPESGVQEGVAFRIEKSGNDELFYYLDDDNWPWDSEKNLALARLYSSGISDLKVKWYVSTDPLLPHEVEQAVLFFKLDPDAVKRTVLLRGEYGKIDGLYTNEIGKYIFVLPRCGEFNCEIGVVRNGKRVPLYTRSFCMK